MFTISSEIENAAFGFCLWLEIILCCRATKTIVLIDARTWCQRVSMCGAYFTARLMMPVRMSLYDLT